MPKEIKKIEIIREPIMRWFTKEELTTACQITLGELMALPGVTEQSEITIGEDEHTRMTSITWTVKRLETQKEMERRIKNQERSNEEIERHNQKIRAKQGLT